MTLNNNICKEHSGHEARLKDLESNVKDLWAKWDRMQVTVLGIFIALALNLAGIILTLIRS